MNKKQKILKMFNEIEWVTNSSDRKTKIITYNHFKEAGLSMTYARQVLNKLGYKVLIRRAFNVFENNLANEK